MTRQIALMGLAMGIAGCGLLSTDVASTERGSEPLAMGTAPYMVIDLSGGPKASSYGVSYLHGVHVMRGGDYESDASRCTSYSRFMGVDSCGVSACGIRLTCSE